MPSLVKVRVERAVDLPVIDSNDGSTDAFVLVKLNDQSFQTSTYRKSLSPVWNEDFIFEVADDSSLQDAPLEFKVMDQGFSASELIGVIYVDMNPLIMRTATDTSSDASSKDLVIQGYFPLFDVSNIKGVRGALKLVIKLQFIGNDNPFRDSSAGVQFFSASSLSDTSFVVQEVLGFVADLVVEDDPETSWQDYFRKAGKSANDNRLKVLYNLSSKVRREIGKKVLEVGGNAVLGYSSHFDIEGTSSLVARAYGTACILLKADTSQMIIHKSTSLLPEDTRDNDINNNDNDNSKRTASDNADVHNKGGNDTADNNNNSHNSNDIGVENSWPLAKTSSDFENYIDISAVPPPPPGEGYYSHHAATSARRGSSSSAFLPLGGSIITLIKSSSSNDGMVSKSNSLQNIAHADNCVIALQKNYVNNLRVLLPLVAFGPKSEGALSGGGGMVSNLLYNLNNPGNIDIIAREAGANNLLSNEIQILSLKSFEAHARIRLGGLVTAKSVKFLGKLEATVSDQETREAWWEELRDEVKSHAKTMCCTHIVGYSETCTIYGEVCVLSAIGTAATVKSLALPVSAIEGSYLAGGGDVDIDRGPARGSRDGFEDGMDYDRLEDEEEGGENVMEQAVSERSNRSGVATGTGTPFGGSVKGGDDSAAASSNPSAASMAYTSPASESGRGGSWASHTGSGGLSNQLKGMAGIPLTFGSGRAADSNNSFTPISRDFLSSIGAVTAGGTSPRGSVPQQQQHGKRVRRLPRPCSSVHVPYNHNMAPFSFMRLVPCLGCRRKWVPENILATIEPSCALDIRGQGQLLEARICRTRRCAAGESDAVKISEALPFIEFDLQRQLMLKLKISGMNAAFGYCCRVQVGQNIVIATATCTAVYLEALPPPPPLQVNRVMRDGKEDSRLQKLQQGLEELAMMNRCYLEQAAADKQQRLQSHGLGPAESSDNLACDDVLPPARGDSSSHAAAEVEEVVAQGDAGGHGEAKLNQENLLKISQYKSGAMKTEPVDAGAESSSSSSSSSSSTSSSEEGEESSLESPESSESSESSEDEDDKEKEEAATDSAKGPSSLAKKDDAKDLFLVKDARDEASARASAAASGDPAEAAAASRVPTRSSRKYSDVLDGADNPTRSGKRMSSKGAVPRVRRGVFRDDRPPVVLEIDDETDIDMMAVLSDWRSPYDDMCVVNLCSVPGSTDIYRSGGRNVTILLRSKISGNMYRNRQSGGRLDAGNDLNNLFSKLFKDAYSRICFSARTMTPCHILGLNHTCNVLDDDLAEIVVTAVVYRNVPAASFALSPLHPYSRIAELRNSTPPSNNGALDCGRPGSAAIPLSPPTGALQSAPLVVSATVQPSARSLQLSRDSNIGTNSSSNNNNINSNSASDGFTGPPSPAQLGLSIPIDNLPSSRDSPPERASSSPSSGSFLENLKDRIMSGGGATRDRCDSDSNRLNTPVRLSHRALPPNPSPPHPGHLYDGVLLTPLSQVSGSTIIRYLGPVQLLFIKDSWTGRLEGSFETFLYSLIAEANAVSRAHVAALGGNALLCHRLVPQESGGRTYRNMTYHMFSVTGDAVLLEHYSSLAL